VQTRLHPAGVSDAYRSLPPELAVDDLLVFARSDGDWPLTGGTGRGTSWAGIVSVVLGEEPLLQRAWDSGMPVRLDNETPVRVAGPYWSSHVAVVPVGDDHLVVFGSSQPIRAAGGRLIRAATDAVAATGTVPPAKLIADELELVHAVRELMDYRPERIADTARHVAIVAARALSCEISGTFVRLADGSVSEAIDLDRDLPIPFDLLLPAGEVVARGPVASPVLEQDVAPGDGEGHPELISRLTLPIGYPDPFGLLVLGHTARRPRGFTELCQRIGRALADASELLLSQAEAREVLAAERDLLARLARTDPLTGLDNRVGWHEAIRAESARLARYGGEASVVSIDIDGLKQVNDHHGHQAGDLLIQAAAELLQESARASDHVARVGGDEFLVLLPHTDAAGARRFAGRLRRRARGWRSEHPRLAMSLSVGWACAGPEGDLPGAVARADRLMYRRKRQQARAEARRRRAAQTDRGAAGGRS
jgi:diguanylate cyclase (GGDEF)-like protein